MWQARLRCGLSAALFFIGGPLLAHDFHAGISDVLYNERTGSTEIVHTFTLHDIDAALARKYGRQLDLGRKGDEALLHAYIDQQFSIESAPNKRLAIAWVGVSADAQALTIYQEIPKTLLGPTAVMRDAVLMDAFPGQSNTVNLRIKGRIKSLLFDQGIQRQSLR